MNVKQASKAFALFCSPSHGPSFGNGDICVRNNANIKVSSSNLGNSYKSLHMCGTNEAKSFLAGSFSFKLSEIEVFQME